MHPTCFASFCKSWVPHGRLHTLSCQCALLGRTFGTTDSIGDHGYQFAPLGFVAHIIWFSRSYRARQLTLARSSADARAIAVANSGAGPSSPSAGAAAPAPSAAPAGRSHCARCFLSHITAYARCALHRRRCVRDWAITTLTLVAHDALSGVSCASVCLQRDCWKGVAYSNYLTESC